VRVGDRLQHLGVHQRRVAGLVGEVELDLEPDRALRGLEARLREHPREDVQAALDLRAVALAILPAEDGRSDVVAHHPEDYVSSSSVRGASSTPLSRSAARTRSTDTERTGATTSASRRSRASSARVEALVAA